MPYRNVIIAHPDSFKNVNQLRTITHSLFRLIFQAKALQNWLRKMFF